MVPYLRAANVKDGDLDLSDVKSMNFSPTEQEAFALLPGDVLVTEGSGSLGAVGASTVWSGELSGTICFQNTLLRLRPRFDTTDPRFLGWWARFAFASGMFASIATGANILHISAERVRSMPASLPDLPSQRRIADFLDRETARIKQLLAAMSQQVRLLDTRRHAVIERHLDSPHVRARPLKYLASIVDTEHKTAPSVNGGGFWIAGTSSVRNGRLVHSELYETDHRSYLAWTKRKKPVPGDVLLSREAPVGEAAIYRPDDPLIAIGQRMVLISVNASLLLPRYLLWNILSERTRKYMFLVTQGSLHPHLNMRDIGSIPVRWMPLHEQEAILDRIENDVEGIEMLRSARQRMLALVGERRQALITAALTGQIDVTVAKGGSP